MNNEQNLESIRGQLILSKIAIKAKNHNMNAQILLWEDKISYREIAAKTRVSYTKTVVFKRR